MSESNEAIGPDASAEDVVHSLQALRRFAKPRGVARERCELCSVPIAPSHRHLLEMENRKIVCACDPCALRFSDVVGGRFKLIPRDARPLRDFQMTDAQWEEFVLPINLVFFFKHSHADKMMALYPSPAGATESLLPLNAWAALVQDNPALATMEPDVEALLVNRVGQKRDYYLAPIDACFELAGLIRANWRGFSGGAEVWKKLDEFFARLNGPAAAQVKNTAAGEHQPEVCHA
jgi:hypothetical protein